MFNDPLTSIQQGSSIHSNQNLTNNEGDQSIKKFDETRTQFLTLGNKQWRAPGTSVCQHTAKIDIRRVRSYRDLTQRQLIYSPSDFVFKEKLGEGFFANVKKLISKESNTEMVIFQKKFCYVLNF